MFAAGGDAQTVIRRRAANATHKVVAAARAQRAIGAGVQRAGKRCIFCVCILKAEAGTNGRVSGTKTNVSLSREPSGAPFSDVALFSLGVGKASRAVRVIPAPTAGVVASDMFARLLAGRAEEISCAAFVTFESV